MMKKKRRGASVGGGGCGSRWMDSGEASSTWNVDGLTLVQRITLAAIMSICGTGIVLLCSYMCCSVFFAYQRRRRRGLYLVGMMNMQQQQQQLEAVGEAAGYGIEPDVLEAMPVFIYAAVRGESRPECAVCLGEFREGEKGRVLPMCRHSFHKECIDMWLSSHSTCPLCRGNIIPKC